jgi:pyruvate/2-oxoglutarate dehydrogenase complex dihydrolipoamide dehydrogenase (E3) component
MGMGDYDYDLAIIGGGSGGLTAAKVGRFFAKRVALIDKDRLGGDCLHYGCVPSKSLIKASRVAHEAATAERWGLRIPGVDVSLKAVNARVQHAIAQVGKLDSTQALTDLGVDVLLGGASFLDSHTLQVGEGQITAKYVLIATGSRPAVPPIPGLAEGGYLTNEDVFDLANLPRRLVVIGGGPIGVELAQAFCRLGSHVTVLQRGPHLIPRDDTDMIAILEQQFAAEGIDVRCHAVVKEVLAQGTEKVVQVDGSEPIRADAVLVAAGRSPNIEALALDRVGVETTSQGITINELLQTSQPHIYAVGDVAGGPQFTHYAGYHAAHAVRNVFVPIKAKFASGHLPWVTFTDPEVAHVGLTEQNALAAGLTFNVVRFPYTHNERAVTDQDPVGLMKFLVDDRRRLIGCHITGVNAGELINELTLAMNHGLTVDAIVGSIHAYPTYSFAIPIALYEYVLSEDPSRVARLGRFLSRLT